MLTLESILNNAPQVIAIADELKSISASFETDFSVLQALGGAYLLQGNATAAIAIAQDIMALARSNGLVSEEAAALSLMGEAQLGQRDIAGAIATFQEGLVAAKQAGPSWSVSYLQGNLGDAYAAAGNWEAALPLLMARVEQERAANSNLGLAISLTNLGNLYLLSENWAAAEEALAAASGHWQAARTQVADPLQAISFFDTQLVTYRNWQKTLVAQRRFEEALVVAEQGRAQALAQQLIGSDNALEQTPSVSLDQLQAIAREKNVTLVEYSLMPSSQEIFIPNRVDNSWLNTATELYIWVISPNGTVMFESVSLDESDLAATILQTREAIGARGRAGAVPTSKDPQLSVDLDAQLQQLHRLLIEPIADQLPDNPDSPVVFVPQESLFLVPFAALQNEAGQYLIERHTILTVPSIQSLQLIRPETANRTADFSLSALAADEAVVVGNPIMPTLAEISLSSLPGTEQEAIAIASQLNTTPLLGSDATEATVRDRLSNARLIHLATHGLLDYGDPAAEIPGAIALTPDTQHDGLLTAAELAQEILVADLVVLSACDTGQGSITGDGMVGLSRSLLVAGVPRVVVSLWAVPDMPTAALMTTFYEQLAIGQGTAQALRRAMLTTMENHPDPKDWAAFTLIGESE
ncbi:MAG: CHAT domain-containing protein [Leptolyngbya sp. SIO4C5]|nr:CHAT domain-containing protein [Leptolyngbya sp. SIO4C5]